MRVPEVGPGHESVRATSVQPTRAWVRIGTAGLVAVLAFAVCAGDTARAASLCSSPNPPLSCGKTPPPRQTLQPPLINAFGYYYDYRIRLWVSQQAVDADRAAAFSAQMAPTANGPWTDWILGEDLEPYGQGVAVGDLFYTDPSEPRCFRAKVFDSLGNYSPWSVVKCVRPTPVVSDVRVNVGPAGLTVSWNDHALYDVGYVIDYWSAGSSHVYMYNDFGNGGTTGSRQVTMSWSNPLDTVCVTIWGIESLPGVTHSYPADLADSVPANPSIWKSSTACGSGIPF